MDPMVYIFSTSTQYLSLKPLFHRREESTAAGARVFFIRDDEFLGSKELAARHKPFLYKNGLPHITPIRKGAN